MPSYGEHIDEVSKDIISTVQQMKCQPIIFAGSGLTKRYIDGPSWKGLLKEMDEKGPELDRSVDFYLQRGIEYPEIGSRLADSYQEWAWNGGRDNFPEEYFRSDQNSDIFLKKMVSDYLVEKASGFPDQITSPRYRQEVDLLNRIQPHAIVTTNYDSVLEKIFPDHKPIIGDHILRSPHENYGEIMKIHGCVSKPESLVLTAEDYDGFNERKKYLSAKLLTYFAEHPVLIVGYSIEDENVQKILSDIDQAISLEDGTIENIYFLKWDENVASRNYFPQEKEIDVLDGDSIRVKYAIAKNFDWVFDAFGSGGFVEGVNLKLLRSVMANTYNIVRQEAPREDININYRNLENAAKSEENLGTLFGVSPLDDPPDLNFIYPYRATEVAEELGYDHANYLRTLFNEVEEKFGESIKDSDNKYHIDVAPQADYPNHRYSEAAVELLRRVDQGEDYEVEISSESQSTEAEA